MQSDIRCVFIKGDVIVTGGEDSRIVLWSPNKIDDNFKAVRGQHPGGKFIKKKERKSY